MSSIRGWVYLITNKAMPGLVKVGFTTKDPILRAVELGGTGVPHPFKVIFDILVDDPALVEKRAHAKLVGQREGKEWFRCDVQLAIAAIRTSATKIYVEKSDQLVGHDVDSVASKDTCSYYGCQAKASDNYKGTPYCAPHMLEMRRMRFQKVRK
jgi:hypothetical protein